MDVKLLEKVPLFEGALNKSNSPVTNTYIIVESAIPMLQSH